MIIACDFDGTLVEHKFPAIGEPIVKTVEFIKDAKAYGHKFILFTCRAGDHLSEAIDWCLDHGLIPDAVNDDVREIKNSAFGQSKSVKPFAHLYIDDRNVMVESLPMFPLEPAETEGVKDGKEKKKDV